ncbi:MAG: RNB domain-containing ribonuclease [bacterium]|nr:RNB domain-containing ribonuclease [bacterium]
MICDLMQEKSYVPMRERDLAVLLQVKSEDRGVFKQALTELLSENRLQINRRGRYQRADEKLIVGKLTAHAKGFGFVEVEGQEEDIYVAAEGMNGAFHFDTVEVKLLPGMRGRRVQGEVVRIIARGTTKIVGTYESSRHYGFVIPDNDRFGTDIFIPGEHTKGAVDGHKVVVELTDYGNDRKRPEGKIIQIIGHRSDPGVDILSIVLGHELPVEFPEKVMHQAERAAKPVSEADCAGRRDLRDLVMVTIDGEDAKDLDDAVSLTKDGACYRLGVHIADVSNYVQENSALDHEAKKRGTSVYLVDRVIPMLPHTLSNGICSLNAGEDRLALSCLMTIDEKGDLVDYEIAESVIRVDRRLSYAGVASLLEGQAQDAGIAGERADMENADTENADTENADAKNADAKNADAENADTENADTENADAKNADVKNANAKNADAENADAEIVSMLCDMAALSKLLRQKRKKRGSIDFDFPETKILLDESGHPTEIKPYERNAATDMIEEFMLMANETVAQHFYWQELPFVYRTHENPDPDKIMQLGTFIRNYGYSLKINREEIHPKEIQKLIAKVAGTPEETLISRLALRSMKQAKYTTECSGHFGLACKYYCHFTSPIRRYPDLQIHRIIREALHGRLKEDRIAHYREILPAVASECSRLERRADEAERETDKLKKAEYMSERIGKIYEGVVSGVTGWGIYVELPNTVEGLVHVSKLPGDYFYYNESTYEMIGERSGQVYKLGQRVHVQVAGVDRTAGTIDFEIPLEEEADGT